MTQNLQKNKFKQQRHAKLIQAIIQYSHTQQEEVKLQKLRNRTIMEINARFKQSNANKNYIFPRYDNLRQAFQIESHYRVETEGKTGTTVENLMNQNLQIFSIKPPGAYCKKRVKSLGRQKKQIINKKNIVSTDRLSAKIPLEIVKISTYERSKSYKVKAQIQSVRQASSLLKLPELKKMKLSGENRQRRYEQNQLIMNKKKKKKIVALSSKKILGKNEQINQLNGIVGKKLLTQADYGIQRDQFHVMGSKKYISEKVTITSNNN